MKIKPYLATLAAAFIISCNSSADKTTSKEEQDNSDDGVENTDAPGKQKKMTSRDYSINKSNSYSDLFLDSLAVEKFLSARNTEESLTRRVRSFYNARNYQFAWFASDGFTEQANAFWNLYDYYTTYSGDSSLNDAELQKIMNNLVLQEEMKVAAGNQQFIKTELSLTQRFIEYFLKNVEKGYIKRKELERFVPARKADPLKLADSILTKKHKDDKYYEDVNLAYKLLKAELAKYTAVAKSGGWPVITTKEKILKAGMSAPEILLIKKRLALTGDMPAGDTTAIYDSSLVLGVKTFQQRYGYTPTGTINAGLLKDINVPAIERVKQLLINMERMRWLPSRPSGNLVIVNLPEFILHMYDGKTKVFEMNVVVGKEGHNTVLFTGDLNQVVFSPYWNVPPSIVKSEIVPGMNRNPNYLASHHMEKVGGSSSYPAIRQLPGPWNSLGLVKFLFPNHFNIYFHDTNAKSYFSLDKRAYSHGCIRLSEPKKMAEYLLRHEPEWTSEKIQQAMNAGKERIVRLKEPIPVVITYYTAWVDDDGKVNFRDDIYRHDKKMAERSFIAVQK
jgi:murein L,D-transpeptidase YcbB/YkuD